jgi:ankyrin repeat protein
LGPALEDGDFFLVKELLQNLLVVPTYQKNNAIARAAGRGYTQIVELLLQDPRFDPSSYSNLAIESAALNGHVEIVKLLLQDPRVDPSDDDQNAFFYAISYGYLEIVELFLQDPRIDPSKRHKGIFYNACTIGRIAIIDRLLQDPRVDPTAAQNAALLWSIRNGNFAVAKRLLQDPRVHRTVYEDRIGFYNNAIALAAGHNYIDTVELLVAHGADVKNAISNLHPYYHPRFECRERFAEICIAMQSMRLPALITVKLLKAACPWSTLKFHSKWNLACAVKHFRDRNATNSRK